MIRVVHTLHLLQCLLQDSSGFYIFALNIFFLFIMVHEMLSQPKMLQALNRTAIDIHHRPTSVSYIAGGWQPTTRLCSTLRKVGEGTFLLFQHTDASAQVVELLFPTAQGYSTPWWLSSSMRLPLMVIVVMTVAVFQYLKLQRDRRSTEGAHGYTPCIESELSEILRRKHASSMNRVDENTQNPTLTGSFFAESASLNYVKSSSSNTNKKNL
eukprot:TRINITY_DN102706_c0_g1_i2.p2 TRINITY_DN102706_c0_g1~~TRINITY_DN102706_c0_g1_i2.p2  ORF type:complete len:212 (-),score=11.52 TRINITY_DN102706_c0_g1_i2:33-668(-)